MSEPDNPRWLQEVGDELRTDVPVRAAWRAQLLDEIARAPRPDVGGPADDAFDALDAAPGTRRTRRSIVLSPIASIAAALTFAALGGGLTYVALSRAPGGATRPGSSAQIGGGPGVASATVVAEHEETVRFELAAPRASRVALVGSFNEWNPEATPLVRDPVNGKWTVSVRLAPGRHVYTFVVDGDVTADPSAPRAADDDFGSKNSVVFVSSPST